MQTSISWADWHDLGGMALNDGRKELAMKLYDSAVDTATSGTEVMGTKAAMAVVKLGDRVELEWCISALRSMTEAQPGFINNWINLSTAYLKVPDPKSALEVALRGYELDRRNADILQTLATCYGMLGAVREEIRFSWLAADIDPSRRWQHAMVNMKVSDDFMAFSKHYAGRKKPLGVGTLKPVDIKRPGTVLVCMEQGLGDLIMMGSIMERLSSIGFELTLYATDKNSIDAGSLMWPFLRIVDQPTSAGSYDYVVNLMDLLEFYQSNSASYINGDTPRGNGYGRESIVGINFTGNPKYEYEYCRGIYDKNIRQSILQSCSSVDLNQVRGGSICDFRDQLSRLSAVITTDTMTAHLAGAMGMKTLVLLAKNHDWRWYHKWYGSHLETVVQDKIGEWDSVLPTVRRFVKEIE